MRKKIFFIISFAAAFYGCGGGGGGGGSDPTPPPSNVSFATDIQPIFNTYCIICHTPGGSGALLILTTGASHSSLVNQPSQLTGTPPSGALLVIPGDSANSVLYQRISGVGLASGEVTMPQGLPQLSGADQTLIKTWIDEGALNN